MAKPGFMRCDGTLILVDFDFDFDAWLDELPATVIVNTPSDETVRKIGKFSILSVDIH